MIQIEANRDMHGRHTAIQLGGVLIMFPFRQGSGPLRVLQVVVVEVSDILLMNSEKIWYFSTYGLPNLCFVTRWISHRNDRNHENDEDTSDSRKQGG